MNMTLDNVNSITEGFSRFFGFIKIKTFHETLVQKEARKIIHEIVVLEGDCLKGNKVSVVRSLDFFLGCPSVALPSLKKFGKKLIALHESEKHTKKILKKMMKDVSCLEMPNFLIFLKYFRFGIATVLFGDSVNGIRKIFDNYVDVNIGFTTKYLIVDLYNHKNFDDRGYDWYILSCTIEEFFFNNIKTLDYRQSYNIINSLFMEVAMFREKREEIDLFLNRLLVRCLEEWLVCAKHFKIFGAYWVLYVLANRFGYFQIVTEVEQCIIDLIPDFEGYNLMYVMGVGEGVYSQGVFYYGLSTLRQFHGFKSNTIFPESQRLFEHFSSLLEKTDWPLEKYLYLYNERGEYPKSIIMAKIEERLLQLVGPISDDRLDEIIEIINQIPNTGKGKLVFGLMSNHAQSEGLKKVSLRTYEQMAQRLDFAQLYSAFYSGYELVPNEGVKKIMGFYFDASYLELLDKKEKTGCLTAAEDPKNLWMTESVTQELIKYVWSNECRDYLMKKF
ncbi:MAG: hypothetical protein RLZZ230_643 [Candidatus Parcubacteria bacterium]|jgi:hypothetical protein